MTYEFKYHKPTGYMPFPLIIIDGEGKSRKSAMAAEFTASDKVGRCFWLELSGGTAEAYGVVPDVDYVIIEHDGSWRDICGAIDAVAEIGREAQANGEKPVVLVIDNIHAAYKMITKRAQELAFIRIHEAMSRDRGFVPKNYDASFGDWHEPNKYHEDFLADLKSMPVIVIGISRGKYVPVYENGSPTDRTVYKSEGSNDLLSESTAVIRTTRNEPPVIIGMHSVEAFYDNAVLNQVPGLTLESLIFDRIGLDPKHAGVAHNPRQPRQIRNPRREQINQTKDTDPANLPDESIAALEAILDKSTYRQGDLRELIATCRHIGISIDDFDKVLLFRNNANREETNLTDAINELEAKLQALEKNPKPSGKSLPALQTA